MMQTDARSNCPLRVTPLPAALLVLAIAFAGAALAAAQPQDPPPDQLLPLQALRQKTAIAWDRQVARQSADRAVIQELARPYPAHRAGQAPWRPFTRNDAEARARDFAIANSSLLVGGADGASLSAAQIPVQEVIAKTYSGRNRERGTDYTIVHTQRHQGIPVFEAELRISITQSGEIWSVINNLAVVIDPPMAATLTSDQALAAARALLANPAATPEADPALYVYPPSSLAWHMNFLAPDFQEVLIDASTGAVLLARSNVRDACSVTLTVRDKDGLGLQDAQGQYYADTVLAWTAYADAAGNIFNASSPAGSAYCRALLTCSGAVVRDQDSGSTIVQQDSAAFSAAEGGSYAATIDLTGSTGINANEASQAFREVLRAWRYATVNYGFTRAAVTVYVDASSGPSSGGTTLYFPRNRAKLDNGPPAPGAKVDDTMLHEYGHALQYGAYGGTWGRPSGCTCSNHGGRANDCSFDALIEGWAEYFPVMIYHHINPTDVSYDWSNNTASTSIESNANTSTEERDEWTFAGALFDIYDAANDTGDTLACGDDEIWTVMRNDAPRTVEQFFQRFITRYPELAGGVEQIYVAHAMDPTWLTLSSTQLDFGETATQQTFTIRRVGWYGDGKIVQPTWEIAKDPWITYVAPDSGFTTTETDTITVVIDRTALPPGTHTGRITITPQYYGRPREITVTCIQPAPAGCIVAWGANFEGQCSVPPPNGGFAAIGGGGLHGLGLKADGSIVGWGLNYDGQCDAPAPNSGFVAIASGSYHSVGLKADGSVIAWGWNFSSQCNVPTPNTGFAAIAAGGAHSLGLKADGTIVAWGNNDSGQCEVPAPNSGFIAIASGFSHSLGLKADGSVVAWGLNTSGQCNAPVPNSGFVAVAAGYWHNLGLKDDGSIVVWGDNDTGQCNIPVPNSGYAAIAGGALHSLGLRTDGSIVAWGSNTYGECIVPAPNIGFTAIAAGDAFSLAIHGCVGDVDGDGHVDVVDLLSVVYSFGLRDGDPGYDSACDFNDDNTVDVVDLLILVDNFGR